MKGTDPRPEAEAKRPAASGVAIRRSLHCMVVGLALGAVLSPVHADEAPSGNSALHDRFYIAFGAFRPKTSTSAQLDSTRFGVGTDVDFEKMLGMQTQATTPELLARYRITDRWRVTAEYFELNRKGVRELDRDIQWGEHQFQAHLELDSSFDFSDLRVSVEYSLFKTTDKEFGLGLGIHAAKYSVSLRATANSLSGGVDTQSVLAPLPVLSAYGLVALTNEWAIGGHLDWFSLSYERYDGTVTSMGVDVRYQPFRHAGFSLGYRSLFIGLVYSGDDSTLKFNQAFQGPLFTMNVSF
jgi:hypothetical protein